MFMFTILPRRQIYASVIIVAVPKTYHAPCKIPKYQVKGRSIWFVCSAGDMWVFRSDICGSSEVRFGCRHLGRESLVSNVTRQFDAKFHSLIIRTSIMNLEQNTRF